MIPIESIEETQRKAARIVGAAYISALLPAVFAEFYVPSQLFVSNNVAQTALNIASHERLYRLGIASDLAVYAIDAALITALYLVLKPISRTLSLVAAAWGFIETTILVVASLRDFDVLRLLSGAPYLAAFEADRLHALARLSISAHGAAYGVGLVFAGLRSTAFCYLWFKSGFIPRALAAWGILASMLMGLCAYAFIIAPELAKIISVGVYGGPIFLFELTMGIWLLWKGIRPSTDAS